MESNGWVMWKMGTFNDPWAKGFLAIAPIHLPVCFWFFLVKGGNTIELGIGHALVCQSDLLLFFSIMNYWLIAEHINWWLHTSNLFRCFSLKIIQ